jgi:drug/metabolite transporter (DMT)-like permease
VTLSAFILVLSASVVHALWNLVAKRVSGNVGVFWVGIGLAGLLLAPAALLFDFPSDSDGVAYMLATGFIHAIYFGLLASSYRHGEMSVVYPLARGTGVAGTALVAGTLIGERISLVGAVGIAAVCAGIVLIGLRELRARSQPRSCILALLVGVSSTGYSIVDKLGVAHVGPLCYIAGLAMFAALFLTPWVLLRFRAECLDAWRTRKMQGLSIGLGSMLTYLVILFAFQMANASYVVAVREVSIMVVAVLSVAVLKEAMTPQRAVAIGTILVGVVLVKMA